MANTVSRTLSDDTLNRIIQIESAGNPNAKAPTSSAAGLGQFINGTWIATVRAHRPDLIKNGSVPSRVGMDTAALQVEMLARFTEDNARALGAGYTDGDLYLAHFLGLGDARNLFRASPSTPAASVVSAAAVNANRSILAGKTCGQVRAWAQNAMITRWAQAGHPDWVAKFAGKPVVLPTPKPPAPTTTTKAPTGGEATAGGAVIVAGGTAAAAASEGWGWLEWSIAAVVLIAACAALFYGWRWWKARKAHAELGKRDLDRMDDEARQAAIDAAGTAAVSHALNQPEGSSSWNSIGDQSQASSPLSPPSSEPSLAQLSAARLALSSAASQEVPLPQRSARKRRRTPSAKPSQKTRKRPTSSRASKSSAARKSSRKPKRKSRASSNRA